MNKFKKALNQINMDNAAEIPIRREKRTEKPLEELKPSEPVKVSEPIAPKPEETETVIEQIVREPEPVSEPTAEALQVKEAEKPKKPKKAKKTRKEKKAEKEQAKQAKKDKKANKKQAKKDKKAEKKQAKQDKKDKKQEVKQEKRQRKEKPEKAKKQKEPKDGGKGRMFKKLILTLLIALIAFGCVWNYHLNKTLRPTFYQVQSSKVVDNVRIVAISDMHLKEFGENNSRLVKKIESYHPDIIVMAGDMNMESNPNYGIVLNLCARLHDTAPIYYCLGNHEFDAMLFKESQIYYDLKAMGVNVLNNETETAEVGLSKLDIIGLSQGPPQYRQYGVKFFDKAMEDDNNFKLVLTHYPEHFLGTLNDYNIDLAICGHAHGGQIRLPVIGGLYAADQGIFPKLCDGYHEIDNSKVIITRGLGRSGIMPRVNNVPEIAVIDINWY